MKKLSASLIFLASVASLVLIFNEFFTNKLSDVNPKPTPTDVQTPQYQVDISFDGYDYRVNWFVVENISELSLHSNLAEKLNSREAKEKYSCTKLINGGFYDELDEHLGLFVQDGEMVNKSLNSETFNSYLTIYKDDIVEISNSEPLNDIKHSVQTGPLLIENNEALILRIKNDKYARRSVAGLTDGGKLVFMIIHDKTTKISGPRLTDIPSVLDIFETESGIDLFFATNLDGGSASAFYNEEITLTENQFVGSIFCIG